MLPVHTSLHSHQPPEATVFTPLCARAYTHFLSDISSSPEEVSIWHPNYRTRFVSLWMRQNHSARSSHREGQSASWRLQGLTVHSRSWVPERKPPKFSCPRGPWAIWTSPQNKVPHCDHSFPTKALLEFPGQAPELEILGVFKRRCLYACLQLNVYPWI